MTRTETAAVTLTEADDESASPIDDLSEYDPDLDDDSPGFERFHDARTRIRKEKRRAEATALVVEAAEGMEGAFVTTYTPSRHERSWLLSSLRPFYELGLIDDVEAAVKGGKEASVYRCHAVEATGHRWLAAKVYRPREFRSLRNDKVYREGRPVLATTGRPVKESDKRAMKALAAGSDVGKQMEHTSWLMYEFTTLERLRAVGGAVPEPIAVGENAILFGYIGDGDRAAPTLHEVRLRRHEAGPVFGKVLRNIALMLTLGVAHGDLSAYNILYWEDEVTLIDFPQVVPMEGNPHAEEILARDVERVCDYFARAGVEEARDPKWVLARIHLRAREIMQQTNLAAQTAA